MKGGFRNATPQCLVGFGAVGSLNCEVLVTVGYSLHLALLFVHVVRTTLEGTHPPSR